VYIKRVSDKITLSDSFTSSSAGLNKP